MSSATGIIELEVPRNLVVNSPGLALDFGGSLIKIVYRTKADYETAKGKTEENATGRLMLTAFPRPNRQEAYDFIKSNAHLSPPGSDGLTPIFTTGVGCTEYEDELAKNLNVKIENLAEFDCFHKAFTYLAQRMPRADLLLPLIHEATIPAVEYFAEIIPMWKDAIASGESKAKISDETFGHMSAAIERVRQNEDTPKRADKRPLTEAENIFPCLLGMMGSGFVFFKVEADGTFTLVDGSSLGGRYFHSMGCLLAGCKTFEELISMAEKGNNKNVDFYSSDFEKKDGNDDMYAQMTDVKNDQIVYCFGKGVYHQREDFAPEDLARALVQSFVTDLIHKVNIIAMYNKVKHVYFCGSFINSTLLRREMTAEFTKRNFEQDEASETGLNITNFDFLKAGSQLGALGALINSVDSFVGPTAKED